MIDQIVKYAAPENKNYQFSVLIPSWNNLEYLKLCIKSIQKNSKLSIQIIVIINEGKDGSKEWIEAQDNIDFIYSPVNIGICFGLNAARSLVKSDYMVYVNDDMYLLPNWDLVIAEEINILKGKNFLISSTMIEPFDTGNSCVVVRDYGRSIQDFKEDQLLSEYLNCTKSDWQGSTWPPIVVHKELWDMVGGLSIEFSPGMYSDPDLSMKLAEAGVRTFKGLGKSLVYHFGSKSTRRVKKNLGRRMFILKWGISSRIFMHNYLNIGQKYQGLLKDFNWKENQSILDKLKRIWACF